MLESVASQDVWRDERSRIVVVGALEELVSSKHIIEAIRKVEFVSLLCLTLSLNVATGLNLSLTERSGIPCGVARAVILLEHLCARRFGKAACFPVCQCHGYSSVPQPTSSFDLEFAIGFAMKSETLGPNHTLLRVYKLGDGNESKALGSK